MEKHCSCCGETKPAEQFYHNRGHADGLSGWCRTCTGAYMNARWRRKHPEPPPYQMPTEKACSKCGEVKPLQEFHRRSAARDGRQPACAVCMTALALAFNKANPEYHRQKAREYSARHPDRKADIALKARLGIPWGTYDRMLTEQDGKCAICGTTSPGSRTKRFHVDHDKLTGAIRGLLCSCCNTGIGQLNHDPSRLLKAISYLGK